MRLVTGDQMRAIDRDAIERCGVPSPELMENAGRAIADHISVSVAPGERIVLFCGKGNNGGDGLVVARLLYQYELEVTTYFIGPLDKLSPDARLNFDRAAGLGLELIEVTSIDDLPETIHAALIVDAILGTGFKGAPRGLAAEIIEYINEQETPVISVDLPSGLNADNGQFEGAVVQADETCTLALPKYGLYVSPGRELAGEVIVLPIGIPDSAVGDDGVQLITPELVDALLPVRKPDGHKGDFGKLFLLAGSTGMTGAAVLAARGALRSGAGLVKVGCPRTALPIIANHLIEATTWPLPDVAKKGALALRGLGEIRELSESHDALVIGPGLGQHHETQNLIRRFVSELDKPAIIDADGLNAFAGQPELLLATKGSTTLALTPHPGEFERLTGEKVPDDIHERIAVALKFAQEYKVTLVLKGSPTVIADSNGICYLNPTGNDGLATGGTGDVLSGIIGCFLAQGLSTIDAAVCGVYVHGLAGDLAADALTARAMIAGDIADFLPDAFELFD